MNAYIIRSTKKKKLWSQHAFPQKSNNCSANFSFLMNQKNKYEFVFHQYYKLLEPGKHRMTSHFSNTLTLVNTSLQKNEGDVNEIWNISIVSITTRLTAGLWIIHLFSLFLFRQICRLEPSRSNSKKEISLNFKRDKFVYNGRLKCLASSAKHQGIHILRHLYQGQICALQFMAL